MDYMFPRAAGLRLAGCRAVGTAAACWVLAAASTAAAVPVAGGTGGGPAPALARPGGLALHGRRPGHALLAPGSSGVEAGASAGAPGERAVTAGASSGAAASTAAGGHALRSGPASLAARAAAAGRRAPVPGGGAGAGTAAANNSDVASPVELAAEELTSIARTGAESAELGGWALAAKARIVGNALVQVVTGSAHELAQGHLHRAWQVAWQAVAQASEESSSVDAATTTGASRSIGILLVFIFIGSCWGLEFFLTKRADERAAEERDEPQTLPEGQNFLHALSFVRYLMSWHVVMANYYQQGEGAQAASSAGAWVGFARWGEIGAPWFFLVSGFCHTYSQMIGPRPDGQDDFLYSMIRKVTPWYPLFLISLTWCALRIWSVDAEDWAHYMADVLLINGIIWEEPAFPYLRGEWWLCYLMVYLLAWAPMNHVITNSANSVLWTIFTMAWGLVFPSAILEWYFMEDWAPWVLIQYWPSFVFGQAVATWFTRNCMQQKLAAAERLWVMRPVHEIPLMVRFGATVSLFTLGIMFFIISPYARVPLLRKPIAPLFLKGGLLPVLGLLVAGLACEVDPIAKLFARTPFRWAEKIAFTNFILQVPIHNTVKDWTGWDGLTWTYSACLLVSSILGHFVLEKPWRKLLGIREK